MSGVCASCDEPVEGDDESLCANCLASPEELEAQKKAVLTLGARVEIASNYRAAKCALRLARTYMREAATVDGRARACLDEAARCREQIRALRRGDEPVATPSERPGLRKAQLPAATGASPLRAAR
jgi:hypothetical protein